MEAFLDQTPLVIVAAGLFAALLLAREFGAAIGRRGRPSDTDNGHILSGILGLLALLIAFTFGLALDRYETRRELVTAEANAIGTADMRVRLLNPPEATRLTALYRAYAETRLRYGEADAAGKPALRKASADLRTQIQTEALAALSPFRTTPLAVVVTPAINESLDVGAAREAAHDARLPSEVLLALVIYALVAAGVLGADAAHRRGATTLMFLLLTLALTLILDLDRPRGGAIVVSQAPMARLVESLKSTPPPSMAAPPPSPAAPASAAASGSSRP